MVLHLNPSSNPSEKTNEFWVYIQPCAEKGGDLCMNWHTHIPTGVHALIIKQTHTLSSHFIMCTYFVATLIGFLSSTPAIYRTYTLQSHCRVTAYLIICSFSSPSHPLDLSDALLLLGTSARVSSDCGRFHNDTLKCITDALYGMCTR